jgi:hypothetical protein
MGRIILAVVVALIVAMAVIMIIQMGNVMVVRPPADEVVRDPGQLRQFLANMPVTAYVVILISYILGAFAGGFIVTKMSRRESPGTSLPILIGVVLTIAGLLNFFVVLPGQPIWFIALSLLSYIPMSLLGHRFAR